MIFTDSTQILLSRIRQTIDAVTWGNWPWTEQLAINTTAAEATMTADTNQQRAAQMFQQAISTGIVEVSQPGIEVIFLADLYRRAGEFETADQILQQSRCSTLEDSLMKVLEYEQTLIQAQDQDYYQIAEALER